MKQLLPRGTVILFSVCLLSTPTLFARTVYLNGIDISSARNQSLKGINLRIDENGNLFIEAPHYQVNEEQTFTPLSSYLHQAGGRPQHQSRQALPNDRAEVGSTHKLPDLAEQSPGSPPGEIEEPATTQPVEKTAPKLQDKRGDTSGDGE